MILDRNLALALALSSSLLQITHAASLPFPDMEHSWYRYREAVAFLREKNVLEGYPDGTFRPKQIINRAELIKIVFKGRSDATPVQRRCFSDVNPDAWYAPYVCAAKRRGIVDGYPNGTFKPGEPVNIAEAIKIVLNAYGRDIEEGSGKEWYVPYTDELDRTDVLPRHSYLPWEELNRERAADLLWRMLQYEEKRIIPRLSPGCGKALPSPPANVTVNGQERNFLLTVPVFYVPHDPIPLIIAYHGRTNNNEQVRRYMRLDTHAENTLIAYPAALSNGNGSFSWGAMGPKPEDSRDITFFDALVELLADQYCIDMDRIFVVGHSLGAWFANSVACIRGDVVRASATVGGDSVITDCAGPAAAMLVHNPADNLAPFSSTEKTRELRVKENSCLWDTQSNEPTELNCAIHQGCDPPVSGLAGGGNPVVWCPHTKNEDERGQYYPHNWPKETALYIVEFFKSLP